MIDTMNLTKEMNNLFETEAILSECCNAHIENEFCRECKEHA